MCSVFHTEMIYDSTQKVGERKASVSVYIPSHTSDFTHLSLDTPVDS